MTPTEDDLKAWHQAVAKAAGMLALTLARRKRSASLISDLLALLEPLVQQMKDRR